MQDQQLNKSSVETTTQKFHLKTIQNKSMIDIKISNAIKKGTVKNFIRSGLSVTLDTPIEDGVDKGLQGHLLQLKKSCSDLTRELKDKQVQANRYKDEVGFTSEKAKKIKDNRRKLEDKIAELERNLNQVSTKKQSALHCSKTYQHILERMKKDGIYKQLQKNQMQRQLKLLQKSHGITQAKNFSALQFEKLSTIGLRQANEEVSLQGNIRKNKLSSVNKETAKKVDLKNKLNERQKQTDQIQELAACDIQDADLLRLKKFLTVQIFLKNLLKSKMNKLKQNFLPYEKAFFQIKSNTCVKDAGSLKKEFLSFQQSYNEKTVWVAHLQEEIAESQQNNENLKKKLNEMMLNHMEIVESMENANKYVERGSLKKLHEKSFIFESTWQRVNSWLKIQAKKLGMDEQKTEQQLLRQIIKKINEAQKPEESKVEVIKQVKKQNEQNNQIRQYEIENEQSKQENEKDENTIKNQQKIL